MAVDVFVYGHHFDKAHGNGTIARHFREGLHFIVVLAAHHDAVQFDRTEARGKCGVDAVEHALQARPARDRFETIFAQRVERDVRAREARIDQASYLFGQEQTVGRERDVIDAGDRGDHRNQALEIFADQRLTAGEANAPDANLGRGAHDLGDFLIGEDLALVDPRQALFGHAVDAAQIAAVRHRDAEIRNRPMEGVGELRLGRPRDQIDHLTSNLRLEGRSALGA